MENNFELGEIQEQKVSKFGAGIAQLYRLDAIWKDSHRHARDVLYAKWNEDLDRAWIELEADATKEEIAKFKEIDERVEKVGLYSMTEKFRRKNSKLYNKLILMQKKLLMEKEAHIRATQNHQGKGTNYEDSVDDYMD